MNILNKIKKDDLLGHASILFSGMMVVHICNTIFQMTVSRALPAEEFTLLAAFLGALLIVTRPTLTIRAAISHYTSILIKEDRTGDVKRLIMKWLLLTSIGALLLSIGCVIFSEPLASFFHMSREAPVFIVAAVLPALFWLPVFGGAAQGLQLFKWMARSSVVNAIVRLLLGAGFVWFLYPACGWAMLGHGMGLYACLAMLLLGVMLALRKTESRSGKLPSLRFYLIQSFIIQISSAFLFTGDVVLVKHYIPDDTEFAFAATLSRMVTSFAAVIPMAMFPKVSSSRIFTNEHRSVYLRSLLYSSVFSGAVVFVCLLFPEFLHRFLFKIQAPSSSLILITRLMAIVMMLSTFLGINISLLLAQRRFREGAPVVVFGILYLILVYMQHTSSLQIVYAAGFANLGALILTTFLILKTKTEALSIRRSVS